MRFIRYLAKNFCPGPLTIISKANSEYIPMIVTANTGSVGVRMPNHAVARRLIQQSGKPLGAPSANRFGHISPTTPEHVLNDLYDQDLAILYGEGQDDQNRLGIESTVVRVKDKKLEVLRHGSLSFKELKEVVEDSEYREKFELVEKEIRKTVELSENSDAPG